jgi:hypothetical protein
MADSLHNLRTALEVLERSAIRTSQGTFVKVEDLKKLVEQQDEELTMAELDRIMGPRTFEQAKARIQKDSEIMDQFPSPQERLFADSQHQSSVEGNL